MVFLDQWLLSSGVDRTKIFTGPVCLKMQKFIWALINTCSDALNFDGSVLWKCHSRIVPNKIK